MDFDELYKSIVPTEQSILEAVDEYTLYCFYTGYDELALNKAYRSPFREDFVPSFSIFKTNRDIGVEYYWKDHATGDSGNVFKLIQLVEQLGSKQEVLQKINEDFGLEYNLPVLQERQKINIYGKPEELCTKIRVADVPLTEAGLNFWKQFQIDRNLLDLYQVSQIKWYWSYNEQQAPYTCPDPTFAYRIGEYYQIYSPQAAREYKFRNDLPDNYFFGYMQLSKSGEKLIIDKSSKDVIFCRRLGLEAVAGKSETTMLPHNKMLEFKDNFKEIYLMLDNDKAGLKQIEKYLAAYPWLKPRLIPKEIAKDKTDLCKAVGFDRAREIITQLIQ